MYGIWPENFNIFCLARMPIGLNNLRIRIARRIWRSVGFFFAWGVLGPKERVCYKKLEAKISHYFPFKSGVFKIWHKGSLKQLVDYLQPDGFLSKFYWLPEIIPGSRKCVDWEQRCLQIWCFWAPGCFWFRKSFWSTMADSLESDVSNHIFGCFKNPGAENSLRKEYNYR